jgi:glycosyltransferase involved in cell wall biosynthesis
MKVLFLSNAKSIHTVKWVNALSDRGHEVHLAYKKDDCPVEKNIDKRVILHQLKSSGTKGYYFNAMELNKLYKTIKPDIVNAHYASGYGILARYSKLKPLILSVWGSDVYDFPYQSKIKMNILKKNINFAGKIASTSYSMAAQVENIMGKKMDITITPFGVDTKLFRPIKIKKRDFTFGVVKTLSKKYGIEYIIKAFKILLDRIEAENLSVEPKLEIYGKGNLEGELKELTKELDISDRVIFNGYIPNVNVPEAINAMDVFCLGSESESESFGVAAVEAMACEVPVIATNVSGFKEVVVNGKTGIIVPKKDETSMAEAMYKLMRDSELREKMGEGGRRRVLELYDWEKNVDIMEDIYMQYKVL